MSAKTGVLRSKTPVFAQPARQLSAIQSGFRVLEAKPRLFLMARARIIFRAKPRKKGIPALHETENFRRLNLNETIYWEAAGFARSR